MSALELKEKANMKILIVDDVPANIDSLQSILEKEGFTILATPSGDRVLDVIAKSDPDLILLDAYLPDTDSFHLCRSLKKNPITMGPDRPRWRYFRHRICASTYLPLTRPRAYPCARQKSQKPCRSIRA